MNELDPRSRRQLRFLIPCAAVLMIWAYAWPSLRLVNITWDEALGDLFFGQRYFSYFTSFDPIYLDFEADPYPEAHQPDLSASPFRVRPWEYYPFANTLAGASSALFADGLGVLDPLDGFHSLNLLLTALLVPCLFLFVEKRLGLVAASLTLLWLFSSPRVIAHLLANIKDFPLMVFFALTAMLFFKAFEAGSARGVLLAAASLGLTLATKANALFFPLLPLMMLIFAGLPKAWTWGRLALTGLASALVTLSVTFAVWPYLWSDTLTRISLHWQYLSTRSAEISPEFLASVPEAILLTTPPLFLIAFAVGLIPLFSRLRRRDHFAAFLLAWWLTPLLRYLSPRSPNFDGVRHFLEVFPAMALIAGWGGAWALEKALRPMAHFKATASLARAKPMAIKAAVCLVLALPSTVAVLSVHPFHLTYWNFFTGGFAGAYQRGLPQAGDYWGTSYRLGLEWINDNAEPDAYLAVPVIEHAVRVAAPLRLRSDIVLLPISTPISPQLHPERLRKTVQAAAERPVYVMFVERRDWMNELMLDCLKRLEPEIVWQQDGTPVLYIYRYQPP